MTSAGHFEQMPIEAFSDDFQYLLTAELVHMLIQESKHLAASKVHLANAKLKEGFSGSVRIGG